MQTQRRFIGSASALSTPLLMGAGRPVDETSRHDGAVQQTWRDVDDGIDSRELRYRPVDVATLRPQVAGLFSIGAHRTDRVACVRCRPSVLRSLRRLPLSVSV